MDVVLDNVLDVVLGSVLDNVLDIVLDVVVEVDLSASIAAGGVVLEEISSSLAQKGDYLRRKDCPCIILCRGPSLEMNIKDK
ncbi:hypothetical protein [Parageobacillus thermoglucosidasius]|uniref:hypothetical protein n=1 Tax=Parageobacillus thermoglucosidasius TaxID=1426 RepID=UPI0021174AEA|nr:hypothetical protein [Parageobacillus thermoglucosidasius]